MKCTTLTALFCLTAMSIPASAQEWRLPRTYPQNYDYWIAWANRNLVPKGQLQMAAGYYTESYRLADRARDPQRIAQLAFYYLSAGQPTTALSVLTHARDHALAWAESHPWKQPNGPNRAYGMASLRYIVSLYGNALSKFPKSRVSSQLALVARNAAENLRRIESARQPAGRLPSNQVGGIKARAIRNGLAKGMPARGFGDSKKVDVWVPFTFSFGAPRGIVGGKLTMLFKPIGQLVSSDALLARGKSGKVHVVYDKFHLLKGNRWYKLVVPITDPDLVAAFRNPRTKDDAEAALATLARAEQHRRSRIGQVIARFCALRLGRKTKPERTVAVDGVADWFFFGCIHLWLGQLPDEPVTKLLAPVVRGVLGGTGGNDLETAERCFRRAIELEPRQFWHYYMLAWTLEAEKKRDEAELVAGTCIALRPASPHGFTLRAGLRSDNRLAMDDLDRALRIAPDDASVHWARASAFGKLDDVPRAAKALLRALELDTGGLDWGRSWLDDWQAWCTGWLARGANNADLRAASALLARARARLGSGASK